MSRIDRIARNISKLNLRVKPAKTYKPNPHLPETWEEASDGQLRDIAEHGSYMQRRIAEDTLAKRAKLRK
jgi:hypothetical protein